MLVSNKQYNHLILKILRMNDLSCGAWPAKLRHGPMTSVIDVSAPFVHPLP